MTNFDLSVRFFLQLAVILGVCRLVGAVARYFGQPQVVAEMIVGVLLGPSLLGALSPEISAYLFPKQSMAIIYSACQVALALYMFIVGLEFRTELVVQRLRSAASVSLAGIITPFALGGLLALYLNRDRTFFSEGVSHAEAVLFLGAAMSITAFPMLARILYERRMTGTSLGTLALAAGSMDDALAWCLLAVVLASFAGDSMIAIKAIGGGVLYAVFTLTILKWFLRPLGAAVERRGSMVNLELVLTLTLVMLGAWYTDSIGIYAVFGAFIMGLAMPRGKFARELDSKIEPLTTNFLLPLFFIYSGLNTRITLVNTPFLWMIAALVLFIACAGKFGACYAAARLNGEPRREAAAIGALMNSRGLMELIILNIGLERGLITPTLFSIMVIMAIVTTLGATPVFEFIYGAVRDRHVRESQRQAGEAVEPA
ncbi:High-affinity Na(+)/H(+) antiporter NhaS3 [Phycisphaerae bacterium RAS1]|nr:High-affinity Na(+)/H(+) antiporter NhaS3 [Phycisphaerae bacterium RAS1]